MQAQTETGNFVYHDADSGRAIPVFYYRPDEIYPSTDVLIVMHGVKRNAEQYRDSWLPYAQQHQAILIAPQFSEEGFPGCAGYNLGGLASSYQSVDTSRSNCAFAILERLFDYIRGVTKIRKTHYLIYGHSAGAQFVHRLILLHANNRARVAVAANAGWYTLPTFGIEFPYGLAKSHCTRAQLHHALQKRLHILLGDADTNCHDYNLRSTPEAQLQGKNRLERGHTKYRTAAVTAESIGARLRWHLKVLPGVGHSNFGMAKMASTMLFSADQMHSM